MNTGHSPRSLGAAQPKEQGFTLIEVLVTFLIISIGLLGLAALQTSTMNEQFEAQQRIQLTPMLDDMAARIRNNPKPATLGLYTVAQTSEFGLLEQSNCSLMTSSTEANSPEDIAARDLCEWNNLLAGAAARAAAIAVGAPEGTRGCIAPLSTSTAGTTKIRVSVAWQGIVKSVPPAVGCGRGDFGPDEYRRAMYRDVVVQNVAS